jgi:hypothetical protein
MPINLFDFMLSLTISTYLGSNIFKGTDVFGNIIKLLRGKTGILFGKSINFIKMYHTKKSYLKPYLF